MNDRCYTIEIDDLLAGAFLATNLDRNRFISWKKLSEYEHKIGEFLKKGGYNWRWNLGRDQTYNFLYYNADFYEETKINGQSGILLKSGKTHNDIRRKYIGYLGLPVLLALEDESCTDIFKLKEG